MHAGSKVGHSWDGSLGRLSLISGERRCSPRTRSVKGASRELISCCSREWVNSLVCVCWCCYCICYITAFCSRQRHPQPKSCAARSQTFSQQTLSRMLMNSLSAHFTHSLYSSAAFHFKLTHARKCKVLFIKNGDHFNYKNKHRMKPRNEIKFILWKILKPALTFFTILNIFFHDRKLI